MIKVEFDVVKGREGLQQLIQKLSEGEPGHDDHCHCITCTATRIANDPEHGKLPTDEKVTQIVQTMILRSAEAAKEAQKELAESCTMLVENSVRPEFDEVMLRMRLDMYNALARCVNTLWSFLPEDLRAKVKSPVPQPMSWGDAQVMLANVRDEVNKAVVQAKSDDRKGTQQFTDLIAEAIEAVAKGTPKEQVSEMLRAKIGEMVSSAT